MKVLKVLALIVLLTAPFGFIMYQKHYAPPVETDDQEIECLEESLKEKQDSIHHLKEQVDSLTKHSIYNKVIAHIKNYEGFVPTVYLDTDGSPTIGYGHHLRGEKLDSISESQADSILRKDFDNFVNYTRDKYSLEGPKLLAVSMFIYNIGPSKFVNSELKKKILNGLPVEEEWLKWKHFTYKGEVLVNQKLLERREFELKVFKLS